MTAGTAAPTSRFTHTGLKEKIMESESRDPVMGEGTAHVVAEPTMRAVVQDAYGSADVLRLARIARPTVAVDEVLMRVRAAGVDRSVWHLMTGLPYLARLAFGLRRPKNPVPGSEVAGTVVAVGSAVIRFVIGDDVFGLGKGAFAEYTVAREAKWPASR
jgi:NADPH:quinone reductase-like Zn-dependent oxidoreductase